jgi:hypothetical protein
MKILFVISISLLLASSAFGQVEKKDTTNSLLFKSFEQKNGFSRTGVSFNYFLYSIGFSFDFFISGRLSVDVAFEGVYSYDNYYTGQSIGAKFWPIKVRSTNKLYPYFGLGYSDVKSTKYLNKNGNFLDLPIGARYLFSSGLQISYHFNFSPLIIEKDLYKTAACFTFGVGWRF